MLVDYDRRIGLDLLVYTPDEFDMLSKEPSSFISSAVKQGVKIYDREAMMAYSYAKDIDNILRPMIEDRINQGPMPKNDVDDK
jgi:hypothetical protein